MCKVESRYKFKWYILIYMCTYLGYNRVVVGSSGILKGKQKLGLTFNPDKLGGIDFTKNLKLTMCSAQGRRKVWKSGVAR